MVPYLTRLRGAAASCKFTVKYRIFDADTSYAEKILSHQLVRGLADTDVQEKNISKAANKEMERILQDITNTVEALGVAKREQVTLTSGLNRQSFAKEVRSEAGPPSCTKYGSPLHKAGAASCGAINIVCPGCRGQGYMVAFCRESKPAP